MKTYIKGGISLQHKSACIEIIKAKFPMTIQDLGYWKVKFKTRGVRAGSHTAEGNNYTWYKMHCFLPWGSSTTFSSLACQPVVQTVKLLAGGHLKHTNMCYHKNELPTLKYSLEFFKTYRIILNDCYV